jgi:phosphoribosylanthranilate isomerase
VVRGIDKAELESELTSGLACTHVQLHGHYEESDARTVKALGRKVVQVHSMKTAEFPRIWLDTDRLLLDTPGPGGGGTGKAFDRSLKDLPNWIGWLDVNSGVEISPGIKDLQQIQRFIQTI